MFGIFEHIEANNWFLTIINHVAILVLFFLTFGDLFIMIEYVRLVLFHLPVVNDTQPAAIDVVQLFVVAILVLGPETYQLQVVLIQIHGTELVDLLGLTQSLLLELIYDLFQENKVSGLLSFIFTKYARCECPFVNQGDLVDFLICIIKRLLFVLLRFRIYPCRFIDHNINSKFYFSIFISISYLF